MAARSTSPGGFVVRENNIVTDKRTATQKCLRLIAKPGVVSDAVCPSVLTLGPIWNEVQGSLQLNVAYFVSHSLTRVWQRLLGPEQDVRYVTGVDGTPTSIRHGSTFATSQ